MINNPYFVQYIPPGWMHFVTGTWTDAAGVITDTICKARAAGASTSTINIPVPVPSNSQSANYQGSKLVAVEIDYEITTAAATSIDAIVNLVTRGINGAVHSVASQAFTYDTGHDTAAERYAVDQHRMRIEITTPFWVDDDQYVLIEFTAVCPASTVLQMLGAHAYFTLKG